MESMEREEMRESKGAKVNSGLHPLYLAAVQADDAFHAALAAAYGAHRAGDARYYQRHAQYPAVQAAADAKQAADEAWAKSIRDFRLAQNEAIRASVSK